MSTSSLPSSPEARTAWLAEKSRWVREQTLKIHRHAPETRVASSLSVIELLTTLYYGGFAQCFPQTPLHPERDRIIISKGHGSICLYPILADLGYFPMAALDTVCKPGSFLGGIPDPIIPGYETINGSLGHGLGVATGISLALRTAKKPQRAFVLLGDGELNEGAVWEAAMFAGHHKLDKLVAMVDCNGRSMLGYTKDILDLHPLDAKFEAFGWEAHVVRDGHDIAQLQAGFDALLASSSGKPKVLIAQTLKGKGVPSLECNPLAHVMGVSTSEIDGLLGKGGAA